MSAQEIDPALVDWATSLQAGVQRRRAKYVAEKGEDYYAERLARAAALDNEAASAYSKFQTALETAQLKNRASASEYVAAAQAARDAALGRIGNERLREHVAERIDAEIADLDEGARAFTALKNRFGATYGSPDVALAEYQNRPDQIKGMVAEVLSEMSDFPAFWQRAEGDLRQSRAMNENADVTDAVMKSKMARALRSMSEDPLSATIDVPTQLGLGRKDREEFALSEVAKDAPPEIQQKIEAHREDFQRLAAARSAYLDLAENIDGIATADTKSLGITFQEARGRIEKILAAARPALLDLKATLPPTTYQEKGGFMPAPHDPLAIPPAPVAPGKPGSWTQIGRAALRGPGRILAGVTGGEAELNLLLPRSRPDEHLAFGLIPGNGEQAIEDLTNLLGLQATTFAVGRATLGRAAQRAAGGLGLGKVATAAATEAGTFAGGQAISPEKMTPQQRAVSTVGAGLLGAGAGVVGAKLGGMLEKRGILKANERSSLVARQATEKTSPILPEAPAVPQAEPLSLKPTLTKAPVLEAGKPVPSQMERKSTGYVSGDVPVSAEPSFEAPSPDAIKAKIGEAVGTAIRKIPRRGALGHFTPATGSTAITHADDIPTAFHEAAHRLDFSLSITKNAPRQVMHELADPFFAKSTPKGAPPDLEAHERFAEFVRIYGMNPQVAEQLAPGMVKHFEDTVGKDVIKRFSEATSMLSRVAGSDPIMRSATNVRMPQDFQDGSLVARAFGKKQITVPEGMPYTSKDAFIEGLFDPSRPQTQAKKFYESLTGKPLPPSADPEYKMAELFGSQETVHRWAETGLRDRAGTVKIDKASGQPMNMEWQLEPKAHLIETGLTDEQATKAIDAILVAQTGLERSRRLGTKTITGSGLGIESEQRVHARTLLALRGKQSLASRYGLDPKIKTALTKDQINLAQEAARRIRALYSAGLDRAVNGHLLSQEAANRLRLRASTYANLSRYIEEVPWENLEKASVKPLAKAVGSSRPIVSPTATVWTTLANIEHQAAYNEWKLSLARLARGPATGWGGELRDFHRIGRITQEAIPGSTPMLEKGVLRHVKFDKPIKRMLEEMSDPRRLTLGAGWMTYPKRVLQKTVVLMPEFAARAFKKDLDDTFIKSFSRRLIPERPFSALLQKGKEMDEFLARGGGQFGFYGESPVKWAEYQQAKTAELLDKGHIVIDPRKLTPRAWRAYTELIKQSEVRPKSAEYWRLRRYAAAKLKYDPADAHAYAIIRSRKLMEFALVGRQIRSAAQMVPFLGARLAGTYSELRAAKRDFPLFAARGAIFAGAMVGAEEAINAAAGTTDRLHDLPQWWRDFYFSIPLDEDRWITIPIGWLAGGFRSVARRAYDSSEGDKKAWDKFGGSMFERFSPITGASELAGPAAVATQLAHNYDDLRDHSIVPDWEMEKPVAKRRRAAQASRIGKGARAMLDPFVNDFALDPRQIDFFIQQSFGLAGSTALAVSDIGREDRPGIGKILSLGTIRDEPKTKKKKGVKR